MPLIDKIMEARIEAMKLSIESSPVARLQKQYETDKIYVIVNDGRCTDISTDKELENTVTAISIN